MSSEVDASQDSVFPSRDHSQLPSLPHSQCSPSGKMLPLTWEKISYTRKKLYFLANIHDETRGTLV